MKIRNSALKIAILVSILHCLLGNLIGARSDNSFVQVVFLPYSLIAGMSNFAGWDSLSLILELAGLILMTLLFYPLGLLIEKDKDLNE
ncbi:hypothetical protein [Flavisolibacter tropicus]|uniref:Uncharacterized protein n=1 Tax=Flavisolibacter tropicus TaxID=1492898 RepID=A0A172TYI1_9BACT|nr:hypothetical protein [Flavisolibacter tropicus]ANE51934.1 hypothetical protein SY85_16980 [Flavisolibacter tropicus]